MPITSLYQEDAYTVWEIKTLGMVRDGNARKLLEDVVKLVQPIMRKRKWIVPLLSEFCPENPRLQGLNTDQGQQIEIRLRSHPNSRWLCFYEEAVEIMLHELTHIQCSGHGADFHKLLKELTQESVLLMANDPTRTWRAFFTRTWQGFFTSRRQETPMGPTTPSGPDSEIMKALGLLQQAAIPPHRRTRYILCCADTAPDTGSSSSGSDHKAGTISNNSVDKESHGLRENGGVLEVPDSGRTMGSDFSSSKSLADISFGRLTLEEQPANYQWTFRF
ncbi:unnamed protein product [Calypogeia fissa]